MAELADVVRPFDVGALIRFKDSPPGKYFRDLGWDPGTARLAFLEIDGETPPSSRLPTIIPREELFPNGGDGSSCPSAFALNG